MDKCSVGQESGNRQSGRDGKLADGQWNKGCDQASEGHQQESEGRGNDQTFAAVHVVGAGFANIEIQRNLACELELHGRITAPQLILKRVARSCSLGTSDSTGPSADASPTRMNVPPPLPRKIGSRNSR